MDKRIIQLETLIALQDETIAELNKEVFRQQQDISRMLLRLEKVEAKIVELKQSEPLGGNERPPHY